MNFFSATYNSPVPHLPPASACLWKDNWDDYSYKTTYILYVFDTYGIRQKIGEVKIGQANADENQFSTNLPAHFETLDEGFFSLGQDDTYYENLNKLGDSVRESILSSLRDMAHNLEIFEATKDLRVTIKSLMRSVTQASLSGQYHRMSRGGARLSRFKFNFSFGHQNAANITPELSFDVIPESTPPTNIHVVIGRNGVGKTRLLEKMSTALRKSNDALDNGKFYNTEGSTFNLFSNLVSVTFSAFDPFEPPSAQAAETDTLKYSYIGLKAIQRTNNNAYMKNHEDLQGEFVRSLHECIKGARKLRWENAMKTLESDPIFSEAEIAGLSNLMDDFDLAKEATRIFEKCSSGHKIVLLTITRLVETVEEKTLVLLDEPEAHLHPPLLSAFTRALSDLLIDRNGVAIIATHSPVILQEVPKNCVWKLRRTGTEINIDRPEQETFGENVGVLTREVFGLEVTQSGFHSMLKEATLKYRDYEDVLNYFNGKLGAEAKAIVRAMIAGL